MENILNEPALQYNYISAEEYLAREIQSTEKHAYYRGEIFAMSGASLKHNRISVNILTDIKNKLRGKKCQPFGSDLRIHIPSNTLYTYPDIIIICGEPELTDDHFDTATNPAVIWRPSAMTRSTGSRSRRSRAARLSPGTYSMTMSARLSCSMMSWMVATFA